MRAHSETDAAHKLSWAGAVPGGLLIVAALALAAAHPIAPGPFLFLLLIYGLALAWCPRLMLFVLPATLPVLSFLPWTGHLYWDEFDSVLLVSLGVGYARVLPQAALWRLPAAAWLTLCALSLSYLISAAIGLYPLPAFDTNAFAGYMSAYNSLRILKGFIGALLLLPLMQRLLDREGESFKRWLLPGLLTGLALVSLIGLWERLAFPGLLDFARDYRLTASFFEMHMGGAAVDAFLALSMPLLYAWFALRRGSAPTLAGLVLAALSGYAVLTTFSRGLYAGLAMCVLLAGLSLMLRPAPEPSATTRWPWVWISFLVLSILFYGLFSGGGYRAFGAALVTLPAVLYAASLPRDFRLSWFVFALALALLWNGLLAWGFTGGAYLSIAKGPYLAWVCSATLFGLSLLLRGRAGGLAAHAAAVWMAMNTVWVADYWGGASARNAALAWAAAALGLYVLTRLHYLPQVRRDRQSAMVLSVGVLGFALVVPVTGNWFFGERFAQETILQDLQKRTYHWRVGADLGGDGWVSAMLGLGLGRFPVEYFWNNTEGDVPAQFVLREEAGNRYLALSGGRQPNGVIAPLHFGQRVSLGDAQTYTLELQARTDSPKAMLGMQVCEKWLLYAFNCSNRRFAVPAGQAWVTLRLPVKTGIPDWRWPAPTRQLSVYNDTPGSVIEIDRLSLTDVSGRDLIINGDFSAGMSRWFYTSDHHHLPWHAKNMWLHIWVEQGWLGVVAFTGLLLVAMREAWRNWRVGKPWPGVLFFSFLAFVAVGLFDSLLDFPRISFLFYLLVLSVFATTAGHRQQRHH